MTWLHKFVEHPFINGTYIQIKPILVTNKYSHSKITINQYKLESSKSMKYRSKKYNFVNERDFWL